ncbi:Histone-lysine N-methyltransferase SETMAR [Melipona quadrifasciata]|uniref:Histone-lysine N-methyltransferase SETMAR n=1 Tax=Melipona quadrifasciata TaxID=166423 RepID=A0A0M8ZYF7_9HYME|nr:Histone-lysine N-methyltransferase SETMAR [Melipona quadrifasciata]
MESQKMHLRHVMLHCFKKGNSAKDTADEIFTVYGSGTTTIRTVRNWFKKFRAGNFELKDEDRSGRPATTDTDIIKTVLAENPRYSVREIDATNIPKTTVNFWKYENMKILFNTEEPITRVTINFFPCISRCNSVFSIKEKY